MILPGAVAAASAAHYDLALYQLAVRNVANWSPPRDPARGRAAGRVGDAPAAGRRSRPGQGVLADVGAARRPRGERAGAPRGRGRGGDARRGGAAHRPGAAARHPAALRALRPHARRSRGGAARDRPRAARAAAAGRAADAVGPDRARARADRRRRRAAARGARPGARPGGARADRPSPAALQQLVDAQPAAARLGPGALHAARAPGRRRRGSGSPTASSREVAQPHRRGRGAGRGDRRRHGGRRLAPARLGPRRARRAAGGRGRARGASTRTRSATTSWSTRSAATPCSTGSRSRWHRSARPCAA